MYILKVTESGEISQMEKQMLSFSNCSSSSTDTNDGPILGPWPFFGLFIISGGISVLAFLITIARLLKRNLSIPNYIETTLVKRTIFRWASLVLFGMYMKYGFYFYRGRSLIPATGNQRNAVNDMELTGDQDATTINHQIN